MEHFIVSARKYRPQTFNSVIGQEAITNTLSNAIKNNHLAQALLFTGPRGVGKTTCARILAKMINSDGNPDDNEDFAFNIFELDAASNNSVDDIRSLTDQVRIPPQIGKYKVYIIDEVHMLSQSAFNAFLKTLEEPPKHCIFILATTEKHKIIPTILSRCQIFDFKRITVKDAKKYLQYIAEKQGVQAEDDALHIIAQKADGAMRDALSIFDRVVSFSGNNLTRQAVTENLNVLDYELYFESTNLILENKIPELLLLFNQILSKGFDGHHFIAGLASHFRDLLVCKTPQTIELLEVGEQTKIKYLAQSKQTSQKFLFEGITIANECDLKYKTSKNQRLLVELALMQLASIMFDREKKKSKDHIIPASFFKNKEVTEIPIENKNTTIQQEHLVSQNQIINESKEDLELYKELSFKSNTNGKPLKKQPEIILNIKQNSSSGLSLSSIRKKKEHLLKKMEVVVNQQDLPKDKFTEEEMKLSWEVFITKLEKQGKFNLASILRIGEPKLQNTTIHLEFPNETNKVEIEREQYDLLSFLRQKLNNYEISLAVSINEEKEEQYTYTPREKFERLSKKNPKLELLRKTFDLDI